MMKSFNVAANVVVIARPVGLAKK